MGIVTVVECATALNIEPSDPLLALIIPGVESCVANFIRYDPVKAKRIEFYPINDERHSQSGEGIYDSVNGRVILVPPSGVLSDVLILQNRPVWYDSDLEVREQYGAHAGQTPSSFGSSTVLVKGTDYWLDCQNNASISTNGVLRRTSGSWATEPGSIKVTYNAGNTAADLAGTGISRVADIKLATLQSVIWNYKQITQNAKTDLAGLTSGPIVMEKLGPYTYKTAGGTDYNFKYALPWGVQDMLRPHVSYAGIF